jgi:outer membrane biosynthesis protein TonB
MKCLPITLLMMLFAVAIAHAQEAPDNAPLLSSDLIAWTAMQSPQTPEHQPGHQQPTPDPNPETKPAQNPTPSQQPSSPNSSAAQDSAQDQNHTPQTFTGVVAKQSDSFVLQASASTYYKLDNQSQVQQYVGQRVRVIGRLDPSINLIHVDRIEPIS